MINCWKRKLFPITSLENHLKLSVSRQGFLLFSLFAWATLSLSFSLTNSCCEKYITQESNNENACCSHPKRNSWQSIWLMRKINDDATAISKQLVYYFMRSFDSLWNAWEQANCWNAQIQPTPVKKADCFVTPTSWATLTFCFHWRQIFREYFDLFSLLLNCFEGTSTTTGPVVFKRVLFNIQNWSIRRLVYRPLYTLRSFYESRLTDSDHRV